MSFGSAMQHGVLLALVSCGIAGCGDGVPVASPVDAAETASPDVDAGVADAKDTSAAAPDADVAPDAAAELPDAGDRQDAQDAPDAGDTATDAAPAPDVADAVDAAADATSDAPDVPDSADAQPPDVPFDGDSQGAADAPDPSCPYYPESVCLHWGVCKSSEVKVFCVNGEPVCDYSAVTGYEEVEKSCDGLDNDCNKQVDDGLAVPQASKMQGVCAGQVKTCGGKAGWQDPDFAALPSYQTVETACDGLDNDCDGAIDIFQQPKKLLGFQGVCGDADYLCDGVNGWQVPEFSTLPFWEPVETMCDGLDNDCNGLTDENMTVPNFLGSGVIVNNHGVCNGAPIRCLQGVWSLPDYSAQPGYEAVEVSCDGLDNDCNGLVDDIQPGLASKQAGVCAGQLLVCSGAIGWQDPDWTLLPGYATGTEWQCDGLDNDCDGLTDEDAACPLWQVGGRGSGQVALSPDGQQLAWTTLQGAQVLDWQTQTVLRDWFGHDHAVTSVAFSADGTQLATTGQLDVLQVWPLAAPVTPSAIAAPILKASGLGTTFNAVAFSPDGGQVAVGDATGTVRIYAVWSGQQVAALVGHKSAVGAIAWLPDASGQNGVLLTGDKSGAVWRWQPAAKLGEQVALMQGALQVIAAMPGTTQALMVAENQAIAVDGPTGEALAEFMGAQTAWAGGALRPEHGGEALLLQLDGTVRRYSLPQPTGLMVDVTPTQTVAPPPEVLTDAAASLSARAGHVAVGFAATGPWQLDLPTGAWTRATARHDGAVHDGAVTGSLLLSAGDDMAIRLWRADDGRALANLWGHTGAVLTVLPLAQLPLAPSGSDLPTLLAGGLGLASGSDDFTVRLWNLVPTPTGVGVLTPKIFGLGGPWPEDLALTADVTGIWAAGGPTLGKFSTDAASLGKKLNAYPTKLGNVIERVAPSPDGKWLALGMSGDGTGFTIYYRILDAKTFAVLHEWSDVPATVHAVAWSGDSARLALAGPDGVIQIANLQSGGIEQQLVGHTGALTALAWSPAGRLLSTSEDGTARVWSAVAGQPVIPLTVFSRHCPAPCSAVAGGPVAVLGGVWQDAAALHAITWANDGGLFAWKGPAGP